MSGAALTHPPDKGSSSHQQRPNCRPGERPDGGRIWPSVAGRADTEEAVGAVSPVGLYIPCLEAATYIPANLPHSLWAGWLASIAASRAGRLAGGRLSPSIGAPASYTAYSLAGRQGTGRVSVHCAHCIQAGHTARLAICTHSVYMALHGSRCAAVRCIGMEARRRALCWTGLAGRRHNSQQQRDGKRGGRAGSAGGPVSTVGPRFQRCSLAFCSVYPVFRLPGQCHAMPWPACCVLRAACSYVACFQATTWNAGCLSVCPPRRDTGSRARS